jgi:cytochrome c oxidase assembly factor 5
MAQGSHRRCCALQEGKPIKECAREVKECEGLRNAYSACKRGQLDARSRLRGNKGY